MTSTVSAARCTQRDVSATGSVNSSALTFDGMIVSVAASVPITPITPSRAPLRSRTVYGRHVANPARPPCSRMLQHSTGNGTRVMPFSKHAAAVIELVVADAHRVVAHERHHLEQRLAVGQEGERAGEHVTGVEQERRRRAALRSCSTRVARCAAPPSRGEPGSQ